MEQRNQTASDPNNLVADNYAFKVAGILAYQLKRRPEFRRDDPNDLVGEFITDLVLRFKKFDPSRSPRNAFISKVLKNRLCYMIANRQTIKRATGTQALSLEASKGDRPHVFSYEAYLPGDPLGRACTANKPRLDLPDLQIDVRTAIDSLPEKLRDLAVRLQTQTLTEISRSTGIPRGTLYDRVQKIREHFAKLGLDRY